MSRTRFAVLAAGIALAGLSSASAQAPVTQLDRIEQKLDTILHRLDQMQPGQNSAAQPTASAASPGVS
ncbi:MAG TPA: hypothetical protein VFE12_16880, partial [Acetobacteraceae bacterium]|nr:hypothetical protein [Acetobacteraceae bacterium]